MFALRRCLLALLLLVSAGAPAALATPFDVGLVSVFDRPGFGPEVSVYNDTDLIVEFAPGELFTNLTVQLFDAADLLLADYTRPSLEPGWNGWTPTALGPAIAYDVVARIVVTATFRQQLLTASLQTCLPGDESDGCLSEFVLPLADDVDCQATPDDCETLRSGGAVLTYVRPDVTPVPEPASLITVALGAACVLARRLRARSH